MTFNRSEVATNTFQCILLYLCTLLEQEDNWVSGANGEVDDRINWGFKTTDGRPVFVGPPSGTEVGLMLHKFKEVSAGKDWRSSEVNKKIRLTEMPRMSRNLHEMRKRGKEHGLEIVQSLGRSIPQIFGVVNKIEGGLLQEPNYALSHKRGLDMDELAKHAEEIFRGCKRLRVQMTIGEGQEGKVVIDLTSEEQGVSKNRWPLS